MDWKVQLSQQDPGVWEHSYRAHVLQGNIADEVWIETWLEQRMTMPSKQYSIFNSALPIIEAQWLETHLLVEANAEGKERLVNVQIFGQNPYQPDFQATIPVANHERRFYSIGNPFIDEPNYRLWEELLFAKLLSAALYEEKGLDFLINRWRNYL